MTPKRPAPPTVERHADGYRVRIRYGSGQRGRFQIPLADEKAAQVRAGRLSELASTLTKARVPTVQIVVYLEEAATANAETLKGIERTAAAQLKKAGKGKRPTRAETRIPTFRELGHQWTSGELHRQFPDQVAEIFQDSNEQRLKKHVYPVLGDLPLNQITRAHCDEVMRKLPKELKSRRHIGVLVTRVLNLAELTGHIDRSPLPRGWLPKPLPRKAYAVLYPSEDAALLAHTKISLVHRLFYGFLHREGMRRSEAVSLDWRDLDLENGVVKLDKNKTNHARWWKLSPGVAEALAAWKERQGHTRPTDPVFANDDGVRLNVDHLAETLLAELMLAGIKRPELHERGKNWGRFGVHSFRRSFVTRSLAAGMNEDWVRGRTGHKSNELLRYRQAALSLAELGVGDVDPLNSALPELAAQVGQRVGQGEEKTLAKLSASSRKHNQSEDGGTGRRARFRF